MPESLSSATPPYPGTPVRRDTSPSSRTEGIPALPTGPCWNAKTRFRGEPNPDVHAG